MRYILFGSLALAGLLAMPAFAQPPEGGGEGADRVSRQEMRERMLNKFDDDGDGKLSDEERQAAREAIHELMGRPDRPGGPDRDRYDRDGRGRREGRGPGDRDRGPGDRGPRRPDGPPGPPPGPPLPPPEELFNKFDEDKNDSLSRDEFTKLAEFVKEHHPRPPQGPIGGHRLGRRPDGPPPGGPGEFGPRGPRPDGHGFDGPPRGDRPRERGERRRGRDGDRPPRGERPDNPPPADDDPNEPV